MTKTWLWSILSLIGWESLSRVQSQITFDTCLSMRASIDGSLYFVIFEWLSISLFYRRVTNFRVWDRDNCHNLSLTKTKLRRGRSRLHSSCCKKCFLIEYKDCMKQVQILYDTWTFGYLLCKKKKNYSIGLLKLRFSICFAFPALQEMTNNLLYVLLCVALLNSFSRCVYFDWPSGT